MAGLLHLVSNNEVHTLVAFVFGLSNLLQVEFVLDSSEAATSVRNMDGNSKKVGRWWKPTCVYG